MNKKLHHMFFYGLLLAFLVLPGQIFSHASSQSYSSWTQSGKQIELKFTIKLTDLNTLADFFEGDKPDWQKLLNQHLEKNILLSSADLPCTLNPDEAAMDLANGYFQYRNRFYCQSDTNLIITTNAIFSWDKSHMHMARFNGQDGNIKENIFLEKNRRWLLSEKSLPEQNSISIKNFIKLGFEHILSGRDHLAFLLALLLLCLARNNSWQNIALLITGFTLGHSSSLFLSMNNFLISDALIVEALIAWSILLLVFESRFQFPESRKYLAGFLILALGAYALVSQFFINGIFPLISVFGLLLFSLSWLYLGQGIQNRQTKVLLATLITTAFGFIHGLGFAGNLQSYQISQEYVLPALLGFNIGVELGQMVVIFIIFICYKIFYRLLKPEFFSAFNTLLLSLLACMASFWFVERSLF